MTSKGSSLLTEAQRAKVAARLRLRPDRSDTGQLLPKTASALNMAGGTAWEQGKRVAALAAALAEERLVVPVPVEPHPDEAGHTHQGLGDDDQIPLATVETDRGASVVAFTSAQSLARWDSAARPMTMSAQRVALTAGLTTETGMVLVDAGSKPAVFLPPPTVAALAGGDVWLPPWEDEELKATLLAVAQRACGNVVGVTVQPSNPTVSSPWEGNVDVIMLADPGQAVADSSMKHCLLKAAHALAGVERLGVSAPRVNVIPKLVAGA